MSMDLLGETFDIHTGAVDLIFPHHENEIAQSEGATGKPFVRYWVHGEHLNVDQQKMSKSVGNIYTLHEIEEMGYQPLVLRYALLSVPHRTKLNFTTQSLEDARNALQRIELFLLRLEEISRSAPHDGRRSDGHADQLIATFLSDFQKAMDDDLNTAGAFGALFTLIRDANTAIDAGRVSASDAESLRTAMMKVDPVLDIYPQPEEALDESVEKLIEARNAARKARNSIHFLRSAELILRFPPSRRITNGEDESHNIAVLIAQGSHEMLDFHFRAGASEHESLWLGCDRDVIFQNRFYRKLYPFP